MIEFAAMLTLVLAGPQAPVADTAVVRGTVFDSIATSPLVGASVQLVRADSSLATRLFAATTDSAGHFIIRGVPAGRYIAGFFHPLLDTLGLELRDRVVDIGAGNATVMLATPSPRTLIRGFCGDSSRALATLIFGHVYDARTESGVENANVAIAWAEAQQTPTGLDIVDRTGQATTRRSGMFALCGVPTDAALSVRVARARDTAVVNLRIPPSGLLHVAVFIGAAGTTGRIGGHVTDRMKRGVVGAHVSASGRETTASDSGHFALDSIPTGSQSIDVRAIGYAPVSLLVSVGEGRTTDVDVALERIVTLPATESRATAASEHLAQYIQTKRADPTGARFIQPMRLEGYPASQPVCVLVSILRAASSCRALQECKKFFLNGTRVAYELADIDADDIVGVELFGSHWPAVYDVYERLRDGTCPIVVFTRCPGIEIRCGNNPASQPIRRPETENEFAEMLDPARAQRVFTHDSVPASPNSAIIASETYAFR